MKMGRYVQRIMLPEYMAPECIAVDGSACSHSEFNLSTVKSTFYDKPSSANLLWLRAGLL